MSNQQFRCSLELDTSTTPFSGRLLTSGGEAGVEFAGWVGLASALERLLTQDAADGGVENEDVALPSGETKQEG